MLIVIAVVLAACVIYGIITVAGMALTVVLWELSDKARALS